MNADERIRLQIGEERYRQSKVAGGKASSKLGVKVVGLQKSVALKRQSLRMNLRNEANVGYCYTCTPKRPYLRFHPGVYYQWRMTEPGLGVIENHEITAQELLEHFVVKERRKDGLNKKGTHKTNRPTVPGLPPL